MKICCRSSSQYQPVYAPAIESLIQAGYVNQMVECMPSQLAGGFTKEMLAVHAVQESMCELMMGVWLDFIEFWWKSRDFRLS